MEGVVVVIILCGVLGRIIVGNKCKITQVDHFLVFSELGMTLNYKIGEKPIFVPIFSHDFHFVLIFYLHHF